MTSQTASRPEEELQYIRKVIDDSRAAFVEDGRPYILWGLLVAVGMGISYISVLFQRDFYTAYVWATLILFGWGSMFYFYRKQSKQEARVKSIIDRIQSSIWVACGIGFGLFLLLISSGVNLTDGRVPAIHPFYVCSIVSMILGIAYFLSGVAHDLRWLRNVGFAWWAGAIVMYIWPTVHVLGIYAAMLIVFQVIPGIILQRRYKRITSQPAEA